MFVAANHLQNQIAVVLTSVSFSVSRANEMAYIRVKLQNARTSYWDKFQRIFYQKGEEILF